MKQLPKIKHSTRPHDCTFLVSGYDTLKETASVYILPDTWEKLEEARDYARSKNNGSNQAYTTKLCGMEFQIKPHGGEGAVFILNNNYFTVAIGHAKTEFNIAVTYRSIVLWQYGAVEARRMIWSALLSEMKPRAEEDRLINDPECWRRVSRVDYAMDFHSPQFSDEISPSMVSQIVCHSSSKPKGDFKIKNEDTTHGYIKGTSENLETITVGNKGYLEVQIYNKSKEITQKSKKTWMYKLWEQTGLKYQEYLRSDVWRLEVRCGRDWLNSYGVNSFDDLEEKREEIISRALTSIRLTDFSSDSNKRRRPIYPLWSQAIMLCGNKQEMVSLEGHKEQAPDLIIEKIKADMKACLRRYSIVKNGGGGYDYISSRLLMNEIAKTIEEDEFHLEKMEEYEEKYKYITKEE